jgi:hypothetical protein
MVIQLHYQVNASKQVTAYIPVQMRDDKSLQAPCFKLHMLEGKLNNSAHSG